MIDCLLLLCVPTTVLLALAIDAIVAVSIGWHLLAKLLEDIHAA
jgi:hypothetical protein